MQTHPQEKAVTASIRMYTAKPACMQDLRLHLACEPALCLAELGAPMGISTLLLHFFVGAAVSKGKLPSLGLNRVVPVARGLSSSFALSLACTLIDCKACMHQLDEQAV